MRRKRSAACRTQRVGLTMETIVPIDEKAYAMWRLGAWETLERHRGAEVIYIEGRHELLVRVVETRATADFIAARFEVLSAPGFASPWRETQRRFYFRASWESVTYQQDLIAVGTIDARIYLDPCLVQRVRLEAARVASGEGATAGRGTIRRIVGGDVGAGYMPGAPRERSQVPTLSPFGVGERGR